MKPASAPRYDLFKLVVTIILIAILLLMLLRGCATDAGSSSPTEVIATPNVTEPSAALPVPTETASLSDNTPTSSPSSAPSSTEAISSPTTVAPTSTATAVAATSTSTNAASTDSAPLEPTVTAAATEIPATSQGGEGAECNTRVPSRLAVGEAARVLQRLNMRSDPSIDATIIQTNPTGTQVEVIGGPVCTAVGERAYLWWQIRLADGAEGWSAEAMLNDPSYLLEPIP